MTSSDPLQAPLFRIDLHVHTRRHSPCSVIDPASIPRRAKEAGLSAVVLTEHGYRWTDEELAGLRAEAGGVLILAGAEITTRQGDFVLLGAYDVESIEALSEAEEVIDLAHAQGGFVVWAHPFRFGEPADRFAQTVRPDAVEVASSNMPPETTARAHCLAERLGALKVVASDAHRIEHLGIHPFALPRPVVDERDLAQCLREMAGACQPSGARR